MTESQQFTAYDAAGRVVNEMMSISAHDGSVHSDSFAYRYDGAGKIIEIQYPGYNISYGYHPGTSLIDSIRGPDDTLLVRMADYTPSGKTKRIIYPGNVETVFEYEDSTDRLRQLDTANGSQVYQRYQYFYYPSGDINTIYNECDSANTLEWEYAYDSLHRLVSEKLMSGETVAAPHTEIIDFTYDSDSEIGIHNVKSVACNGMDVQALYHYDPKGNALSSPYLKNYQVGAILDARTITYNIDNMPLSVSIGGVEKATYVYDENGSRVREYNSASSSQTLYFSDKFERIDGTPVRYIFAGNMRIGKVAGTTKLSPLFYHKDHLSSSTFMTNMEGEKVDGDGCQLDHVVAYTPYGLERSSTPDHKINYIFTDQELDRATGLYNYNARLYDPVIGMFITPDSVVPDWADSQSLNRYAYCRNNPLVYVDPSGHEFSFSGVGDGNPNHYYLPMMDFNSIADNGFLNTFLVNTFYAPVYNLAADSFNEVLGIQQNGAFESGAQMAFFMLGMPEGKAAINALSKTVGPFVSGAFSRKAGNAAMYAVGDFAEVSGKISQKQLRHIAGRKEYRGGGYLNNIDDAQHVLDAYNSGQTTILGKSKHGFPIVRYDGVTGTNVNVLAGFPDQPTRVFMIKGTKSPSVVPMNPYWKL